MAGWWFGFFFFPFHIWDNPSQLTFIFLRGVGIPPATHFMVTTGDRIPESDEDRLWIHDALHDGTHTAIYRAGHLDLLR